MNYLVRQTLVIIAVYGLLSSFLLFNTSGGADIAFFGVFFICLIVHFVILFFYLLKHVFTKNILWKQVLLSMALVFFVLISFITILLLSQNDLS
jgi:hypothetical protein